MTHARDVTPRIDKALKGCDKIASFEDWLDREDFRKGILRIDDLDFIDKEMKILEFMRDCDEVEEVTIYIMSPGGKIYTAFAIFDEINLIAETKKVNLVVQGYAASAAAMIILQSNGTRLSMPSARFLLHEPRRTVFFASERESELQDITEEIAKSKQKIISLMATRCGRTEAEVKAKIDRKESWMSADEALEWGLIDGIIGDKRVKEESATT
jgi:ATP-dependent Clp protease, protease subunit